MLRRRWDYLNDLYRGLSVNPGNVSKEKYSEAIYQTLRENAFEELDMLGERSLQCCGRIFSAIPLNDSNVITPEDIQYAVKLLPSNTEGRDNLQLENEVPFWLGQADLEEVNASYCKSDFSRFSTIYVAPIAPKPEKILSVLGNPAAISDKTIHQMVVKAFSEHVYRSESDWSDRCREVDVEELDAFSAWIKSELESEGWLRIEDRAQSTEAWVNPDRVEENIRKENQVLSEQRLVRTLIEEALNPLVEIPNSATFTIDGYVNEMMKKFPTRFGWKKISMENGIWWYASSNLHKAELLLNAREYQKAIDNLDHATKEEIRIALSFLEENDRALIRELDTTRELIDNAQTRLTVELEKRRLYTAMQNAEEEEVESDIETKFELEEPPSLYQVQREFEEALREKREEEEQNDEPEVYKP